MQPKIGNFLAKIRWGGVELQIFGETGEVIMERRSVVRSIMSIPSSGRGLNGTDESTGSEESFADVFFGFADQIDSAPENLANASDDESDEKQNLCDSDANKAFWQTKEELLLATLRRSSSLELKIRRTTKDLLKELNSEFLQCGCQRSLPVGGCRSCLKREMCNRLRNAGYDCGICQSKWKSSSNISSGKHSYLEVANNSGEKKGEVRVVIELNFRSEFEIARASDEYNRLVSLLPEVYVGKSERLKELIQILCTAAKKCMKEKKMHLGPWRKQNYMQAKWLGTFDRTGTAPPSPLPVSFSERPRKAKASLLTFDLVEKLPNFHCTAVRVV